MDRGRKHVQISFDDLNRIRILDPEHFKQTEGLADECTQFNESERTGGENSGRMREAGGAVRISWRALSNARHVEAAGRTAVNGNSHIGSY
jgi:hypothetical protein